jgi:hypothetical protein
VLYELCWGECNVPFLLHSALPCASRGCCKILCQFPPTVLPFPPMYQAHKTDSVKGTMTPAPLVASLLQYRSSLTPIVSSYSCRSCPGAIEIILAIAINRFLAIFFQRLLGMVPKWNGSRQTLCRLNPMPVNTQERMMERRRCARSLQHRCSSIRPFSHCQFASSRRPSCTRPQPPHMPRVFWANPMDCSRIPLVYACQIPSRRNRRRRRRLSIVTLMDRPLDRPW